MSFDETLAGRLRPLIQRQKNTEEKRMFGGLGFLRSGHLWVGIWKQSLIARIGPDAYEDCLVEPHVRPFDITGRPMTGWILIDPDGFATESGLRKWVELSLQFVRTLPPK